MTDFLRRISEPVSENTATLRYWRNQVVKELNELPSFSVFSTADGPNSSGETGTKAMLGIDVGSSQTRLWVATSNGTGIWTGVV